MEDISLDRRDLVGLAKLILIELNKIHLIMDGVIKNCEEDNGRANSESNQVG